jgi:hypothetical protein
MLYFEVPKYVKPSNQIKESHWPGKKKSAQLHTTLSIEHLREQSLSTISIGPTKFSQTNQTLIHTGLTVSSLEITKKKNSDNQIQQFHWS